MNCAAFNSSDSDTSHWPISHPQCSRRYINKTLSSLFKTSVLRFAFVQFLNLFLDPEFTTMAGRRLRDAIKSFLISSYPKEFSNNMHVVIAGLTNTYSQYIATFEEYEVQRYEVCKTHYLS